MTMTTPFHQRHNHPLLPLPVAVMPGSGGKRRADPNPPPRWLAWAIAVLVVAALAVGFALSRGASDTESENRGLEGTNTILEEQRDATAEQALRAADPVLDLCADPGEVGEALRTHPRNPCGLAEQVRATPIPGPVGPPGEPGAEGRGILGTSISGGRLLVTYTDGQIVDVGVVVGAPGAEGQPGRGVVGSVIEGGRLILTYSDGGRVDVGQVVGAAGARGEPGADGSPGADGADGAVGRGVASVEAVDGRLAVTYTDGTTSDVGPLPVGARGAQGIGVQSVRAEERPEGCLLVFVLVDPATDTTAEETVPVADELCDAGPLDLEGGIGG